MSNILKVDLAGRTAARTCPLYQYDYGQILKITGIQLPGTYEVQFSNEINGVSTTAIGDADGVIIPDAYLQGGNYVYAWLYLHTGADDGETEYMITIPVIRRARITNQQPTPVQQDVITQAIAALNAAIETTGQDVTDAQAAKAGAEAAQGHAEAAQSAAESARDLAQGYAGDAAGAAVSAGSAQGAAELAQGAAEDARDLARGYAANAADSAQAAYADAERAERAAANAAKAVRYDSEQSLTTAQQTRARMNISAAKVTPSGDDGLLIVY